MRGRDVIVVAALILVAAACESGSPDPSLSSGHSAPSDRYGAPVVSLPRDISAFAVRPCELVSAAERRQLSLTGDGRQRTSIDVQECSWVTANDGELAMAVNADRDLLADTYRTRLTPIFVPSTVEGLPAVRQRMATNDNTCTVTTGLGPKQALETEWSGPMAEQTSDPCQQAEDAITLVIRKLPPQK